VKRSIIGVKETRFALVKREAGENPARTRRCNEGVLVHMPLTKVGKAHLDVDS